MILLEYSKNDPIPELNRNKNKLAIFMFGAPAAGKTTFFEKFIKPRNATVKMFNPDIINALLTRAKDERSTGDKYDKRAPNLALKYLLHFMKTGKNFAYDTTGNSYERVMAALKGAHENGYTILAIHLMVPLKVSIERSKSRGRTVPEDFVKLVHAKSQKFMSMYGDLVDKYYIVKFIDDKREFYLYQNGQQQFISRQDDQYKPYYEYVDGKIVAVNKNKVVQRR